MTDKVEVDISTFRSDASNMADMLSAVRKDMEGMFQAVEALDATWDGPSSEAFKLQFLADKQAFEELATAVDGIIASIDNAVGLYTKCEAEVSSTIDSIKIG